MEIGNQDHLIRTSRGVAAPPNLTRPHPHCPAPGSGIEKRPELSGSPHPVRLTNRNFSLWFRFAAQAVHSTVATRERVDRNVERVRLPTRTVRIRAAAPPPASGGGGGPCRPSAVLRGPFTFRPAPSRLDPRRAPVHRERERAGTASQSGQRVVREREVSGSSKSTRERDQVEKKFHLLCPTRRFGRFFFAQSASGSRRETERGGRRVLSARRVTAGVVLVCACRARRDGGRGNHG